MRRQDRPDLAHLNTHYQGYYNQRHWNDPRCKVDARGWIQPFSHYQGWSEYNTAAYALRCVMTWRRFQRRQSNDPWPNSTQVRIESDLRTFHYSLARSRACDRPRLP